MSTSDTRHQPGWYPDPHGGGGQRWWDGAQWSEAAVPPRAGGVPVSGAVLAAAGAALVIGSFMPWVTARAAFIGQVSRSGVEGGGDGLVTAGVGVVAAAVGGVYLVRRAMTLAGVIVAVLGGLAATALCAWDLVDVQRRAADLDSDFPGAISTGAGLWLCLVASVAVLVGAGMMWGERTHRRQLASMAQA